MKIPCFHCGCTKEKIIDKDYINYILCEYEVVCESCGNYLNYWAYGSYSDPQTFKELIMWKPYPILMRMEILLKSLYWIVRNKI